MTQYLGEGPASVGAEKKGVPVSIDNEERIEQLLDQLTDSSKSAGEIELIERKLAILRNQDK